MLDHGFRKYEIIKLLNDIKKRIKRVEESVPTQIDNAINQLLDGAPEALDTLKELANALGNNDNFATSITNQITELNNRINNINIKKDWNQNDENADDYIENRTHWFEKGIYAFYRDENLTERIKSESEILNLINTNNGSFYLSGYVYNANTSEKVNDFYYKMKRSNNGVPFASYNSNNPSLIGQKYFETDSYREKFATIEEFYNIIENKFNDKFIGTSTVYKFKAYKFQDEYHKLDSNYLPDNINDSIILKETTISSGGFEPNRFYELGEITQDTTFTLKTPINSNILNKYTIQFSIGTTVPTITWPSNIKWENGNAPTINASKTYLLEIIDNLAQIKEF